MSKKKGAKRDKVIKRYLDTQSILKDSCAKLKSPASNRIDISIVVPVFNEERFIHRLLSALDSQSYKEFELIIVNNGSTDKTEEIINKYSQNSTYDIFIVNEDRPGIGNARKRGMDEVLIRAVNRRGWPKKKHIMLLTDADVIPPRDWTRKVKDGFVSMGSGALSGTHGAAPWIDKLIEEKLQISAYFNKLVSIIEWFQQGDIGIIKMSGPNAAFEIEAYCAGGGMQQPDDIEQNKIVVKGVSLLGWRLEKMGYPIQPMKLRVISSKRRQLLEIMKDKGMYITNRNLKNRIFSVREEEEVLLKRVISDVPKEEWVKYQGKVFDVVFNNIIYQPITDGRLNINTLNRLFKGRLQKRFANDISVDIAKYNRVSQKTKDCWSKKIVRIYDKNMGARNN